MNWSDVVLVSVMVGLMVWLVFRARRRGAQPRADDRLIVDRLHTWAQQAGGRAVTDPHRSPAVMDRPEARSITPLAVVDVRVDGRRCQIGAWDRTSANLASPVRFAFQELVAVVPGPQRTTGSPFFGIGHLDGRPGTRRGTSRGSDHARQPPTALRHLKPQLPWGMRGALVWPAPDITMDAAALEGLAAEIARRGAWLMVTESDLEIAVPARSVMPEELAAFAVRAAAALGR